MKFSTTFLQKPLFHDSTRDPVEICKAKYNVMRESMFFLSSLRFLSISLFTILEDDLFCLNWLKNPENSWWSQWFFCVSSTETCQHLLAYFLVLNVTGKAAWYLPLLTHKIFLWEVSSFFSKWEIMKWLPCAVNPPPLLFHLKPWKINLWRNYGWCESK